MKLFAWLMKLFDDEEAQNDTTQMVEGFVITDSQHYIHSKEII